MSWFKKFNPLADISAKLDLVIASQKRIEAKMADIASILTDLQTKVAAEITVDNSAITLINGIPALIAAAVANAGLTPTQAQAFTDLGNQIAASSGSLGAAVTANTPTA